VEEPSRARQQFASALSAAFNATRASASLNNIRQAYPLILRAIAVAGAKRASALPDVPTVAEQGVAGFEAFSWFGLVAPAKTSAPVLDALQAEVETVLKMSDVQKRLAELGAEPGVLSGAAFGKFLAEDTAKWTRIIQASGATAD